MPFLKVTPEKLSNSVVRQIEQLILRGILRPGERLPSERDLADKLGVSRPSLRDAISDLAERGLLVSRAGSGIFVAEVLGSAFSPALTQLFSAHEEAVFDYISFRRDIEGLAAERAATFGSETDLNRLGFWLGAAAQSNTDEAPDTAPPEADLATARHLGRRVAAAARAFARGRAA